MMAFVLIQWSFRCVWYLICLLKTLWNGRKPSPSWVDALPETSSASLTAATPANVLACHQALAPTEATLEASEKNQVQEQAQHIVPVPTLDFLGGQSLIRYGEGFSVVCHFYLRQARVSRVIWLDYVKLQRKHGAYVVRCLRTRAGENVARMQSSKHHASHPLRPWGRIALPDDYLEFDSLQDLRVIRLMEKTVEDANALIEEEIPENLLNKRPWRLLPPAAAPEPELTDLQKRRKIVNMSMDDIRAEDAARKKPLARDEKQYPQLIKPPVVRSHIGVLRNAGYVERKDPSGRSYRTFFAELEQDGGTVRHTGVDLQRALLREQIDLGDRVEVFNIGLVPVGSGKYKKKIWSARKLPA